jgi:hypothetical protein
VTKPTAAQGTPPGQTPWRHTQGEGQDGGRGRAIESACVGGLATNTQAATRCVPPIAAAGSAAGRTRWRARHDSAVGLRATRTVICNCSRAARAARPCAPRIVEVSTDTPRARNVHVRCERSGQHHGLHAQQQLPRACGRAAAPVEHLLAAVAVERHLVADKHNLVRACARSEREVSSTRGGPGKPAGRAPPSSACTARSPSGAVYWTSRSSNSTRYTGRPRKSVRPLWARPVTVPSHHTVCPCAAPRGWNESCSATRVPSENVGALRGLHKSQEEDSGPATTPSGGRENAELLDASASTAEPPLLRGVACARLSIRARVRRAGRAACRKHPRAPQPLTAV